MASHDRISKDSILYLVGIKTIAGKNNTPKIILTKNGKSLLLTKTYVKYIVRKKKQIANISKVAHANITNLLRLLDVYRSRSRSNQRENKTDIPSNNLVSVSFLFFIKTKKPNSNDIIKTGI